MAVCVGHIYVCYGEACVRRSLSFTNLGSTWVSRFHQPGFTMFEHTVELTCSNSTHTHNVGHDSARCARVSLGARLFVVESPLFVLGHWMVPVDPAGLVKLDKVRIVDKANAALGSIKEI